jgi:hypothetical protein
MATSAELIKSVAALLWPVLGFVFLWLYKDEISGILKRLSHLRKGKLLGQEIKLSEELDELQRSADKAEQEAIVSLPPPHNTDTENIAGPRLEEDLLSNVSKSPKVTLMLLAAEIERRVRQILATTGWEQNIKPVPLSRAVDGLRSQGSLPEHVGGSVKLFLDVRNKIVHGGSATDDDVLRAIDSGFTLLKAIDSIPVEKHVVFNPGVPVYSDAQCQNAIPDVRGLILEATSPGGTTTSYPIFPTTRSDYRVGDQLTWEWSFGKQWGAAWYTQTRLQTKTSKLGFLPPSLSVDLSTKYSLSVDWCSHRADYASLISHCRWAKERISPSRPALLPHAAFAAFSAGAACSIARM